MNEKKTIWENNPIIVDLMIRFNINIELLSDGRMGLMIGTNDITKSKKKMRIELNNMTFTIKEALRIYYQINNLIEDMLLLTYPKSKLTRALENDFYVEACRISDMSVIMAAMLDPFGITANLIAKLKADLQIYYKMTPEKKKVLKAHVGVVKFMDEKTNETRLMLRNTLDGLINVYNTEEPDFIKGYKLSRKRIKKTGKHKYYTVLISGKTSDYETAIALGDVIIVAGKKKKTCISDSKGNFKIRVYLKDADTLTVSRQGYNTQTINIPAKHKKNAVTINVSMEKESTMEAKSA